MSCIVATLTQKQTGIAVNLSHKDQAITANIGQICSVFIGYPLYVADGRLYAADGPIYVDRD